MPSSDRDLTFVPGGLRRIVEHPDVPIGDALAARVDEIWMNAPASMFDGHFFNVARIEPDALIGSFTTYRHFYASQRDEDVARQLRLRPLGVSGLVRTPHGTLLGRRADDLSSEAGRWELPPSGSVSPDARRGETIDLREQLLEELEEETGIARTQVLRMRPLGLAITPSLIDVCFALDVEDVAIDGNDEYSELRVVPADELETFAAEHDLIALSRLLLQTTESNRSPKEVP